RVDDVHRVVDELAAALSRVDRRVDSSLSRTSLIRYDAYEDTGGHQSASIALLDSERSGIVLTAIQGRDYARVYVKQLDRALTGGAAGRGARDGGDLRLLSTSYAVGHIGPGTRPERELRTAERVLGSTCARARVQGQGGDPRGARHSASLGH